MDVWNSLKWVSVYFMVQFSYRLNYSLIVIYSLVSSLHASASISFIPRNLTPHFSPFVIDTKRIITLRCIRFLPRISRQVFLWKKINVIAIVDNKQVNSFWVQFSLVSKRQRWRLHLLYFWYFAALAFQRLDSVAFLVIGPVQVAAKSLDKAQELATMMENAGKI